MRTIVSRVVALALLIGFVLTTVVGADGEKQPTIIIEEMVHELGKQYERKVFKHSFKVKNTGNADLQIEQVKPG
jgi:hypothetical protein